jgi:hypothetical protein
MEKKTKISKKALPQSSMVDIQEVNDLITSCHRKLEKLYLKATAELSKAVNNSTKMLSKAKKTLIKATKNKKKSPQEHTAAKADCSTHKDSLAEAKTELGSLKQAHKQFSLKQKALLQVDKAHAKANLAPKKKRKVTKKAVATKAPEATSHATSEPTIVDNAN